VVHDAGRYYELSLIEAEILRDVNGAGGRGTTHCCVLLNFFKLDGHACMVGRVVVVVVDDIVHVHIIEEREVF